jgi:hypothetical protein
MNRVAFRLRTKPAGGGVRGRVSNEERAKRSRSSRGERLSGNVRLNLLEVLSRGGSQHTPKHRDKRAR